MRRAYSYIRFSRPEQLRGDSLRRQATAGAAYAEQRGWNLDHTLNLHDLGVSAFKSRNAKSGALGAFLELVDKGTVAKGSILIVESLDRMSRDEVGVALTLWLGLLNKGITIVTLTPEAEYTKASINDIASILIAIICMARAHEESATKSKRLSAAWQQKRAAIADGRKLTGLCPAWLKLADDKKSYKLVAAKVEIIRRIIRLALDGWGRTRIARHLNQEGIPGIGWTKRSGTWHRSYIHKILRSRALIGEYQPHTGHAGPDRKPIGKPIPNSPRVISDNDFFKLQANATGKPKGRNSLDSNLFSGLLYDARDGRTLTLVNKDGKRLVNSGAARGVKGTTYCSFPYPEFEHTFLAYLPEINADDICAHTAAPAFDKPDYAAELADLDARIAKIKKRLATDGDLDALMDVVSDLSKQRAATVAAQNKDATETAVGTAGDTLDEAKRLAKLNITDPTIRPRLKMQIRRIVSRIDLALQFDGTFRQAVVEITFASGKTRIFGMAVQPRSLNGERIVQRDFLVTANTKIWSVTPVEDRQKIPKPRRSLAVAG